MNWKSLVLDALCPCSSPAIFIDSQGYPPDEAGSLDAFRYRYENAPSLFIGAFVPAMDTASQRRIVGYVCATLSPSATLTHESMSKHEPEPGPSSVCVHSVCIGEAYRRRGVALALLKEYVQRLETTNKTLLGQEPFARLLIITHEELRGLYEKAGFEWVGKSDVVHGSKPWFEMRKEVIVEEPSSMADARMVAILQAFQQSGRQRPSPKRLGEFASIDDVVLVNEADGGKRTNQYPLLCPREGCGCLILSKGVAKLVESPSIEVGHIECFAFLSTHLHIA